MSDSREGFRAALAGQTTGRIVAGPLVAADHAAQICGLPVSQVVQSAELLAKVLGSAQELYRGDFLVVFSDVAVEAEAMGCRLEFPQDAPPHVVEPIDPVRMAATNPHSDGRLPMMIAATASLVKKFDHQVPVFASMKDPFSAAALACGTEDFLALLIFEPEKAQFAIGMALENQKCYLEALIETGAHIIIGAPLASGGILGAAHFRDFAFEPIKDLVERACSGGAMVGLHSCGDADPILDLLAAIPVDFLSLESFNVRHWKRLASNRCTPALMGYFPTGLLLTGTEQEIEREVHAEVETLRGFPHLMATACDVPQMAPLDHVQIFMRTARQLEIGVHQA